jgi:hypothetical protein
MTNMRIFSVLAKLDLLWIVDSSFLKGYDAGFSKNLTLSRNFGFEKKISGGS